MKGEAAKGAKAHFIAPLRRQLLSVLIARLLARNPGRGVQGYMDRHGTYWCGWRYGYGLLTFIDG